MRGVYAFIDPGGLHRTDPTPTTGLYKRDGDDYIYVGQSERRCACGAYIAYFLVDACPICGAATTPAG